jgi:hypothetical protein
MDEPARAGNVIAIATTQVVDHDKIAPRIQAVPRDVRADESRASVTSDSNAPSSAKMTSATVRLITSTVRLLGRAMSSRWR